MLTRTSPAFGTGLDDGRGSGAKRNGTTARVAVTKLAVSQNVRPRTRSTRW
jgi:hypothetical protein